MPTQPTQSTTTNPQHPVAVVGIVGPYHTGKSFLLNQVARSLSTAAPVPADPEAETKEVFTIGRGVDPETSGERARQLV